MIETCILNNDNKEDNLKVYFFGNPYTRIDKNKPATDDNIKTLEFINDLKIIEYTR